LRKPVSAARVVCGRQPVAATSSARVAPSPRCSSAMTSAILVPLRGDIGIRAAPLSGVSTIAAGFELGSGCGSASPTGWSARRSVSPWEGGVSSTAIAFTPTAVSLSVVTVPRLPDPHRRGRQAGRVRRRAGSYLARLDRRRQSDRGHPNFRRGRPTRTTCAP
jgi:hypothetical protein